MYENSSFLHCEKKYLDQITNLKKIKGMEAISDNCTKVVLTWDTISAAVSEAVGGGGGGGAMRL